MSIKKLYKVCDYVIYNLSNKDRANVLNSLRLHKLLFYIQVWYLVFYDKKFFEEDFQAWINGPVGKNIHDRFGKISMYSPITLEDISNVNYELNDGDIQHIQDVLLAYGHFNEGQLVTLVHNELPWIEARNGYTSDQRCEIVIDENTIKKFYEQQYNKEDNYVYS